ncbi:uncharacterized protein LOC113600600 isoform X2 [Acinonyx jubatus]|uniref:Uncharacterized protein LOC113600600 isoform X2 n=1 Tax=Acinonyx jubatus TaxID=32536 RepID=A0ABM3NX28_ACIJB|nr:uncharacterized protein LOC113600600 isoform X2 [Acinonyx jubatus]
MDHKALVPEGRKKATVSPRAGRTRALSPARLAARPGCSRRSGLCSFCASASASAGGRREPPRGTASWKAPASRRLRSSGSRHGGDGGLLLAVRALAAPGGAARRARASGPKPNTDWDSEGSPGSRFSAAAGVPGAHSRGGGAHSRHVLLTVGFQVRELGRVRAGAGVTNRTDGTAGKWETPLSLSPSEAQALPFSQTHLWPSSHFSGNRRRWFPVTPRRGCNWITSCSLECLKGRLVSLQTEHELGRYRDGGRQSI